MDEVSAELGRLLPCRHEFCFACIKQWTECESSACPVCRAEASALEHVRTTPVLKRTPDPILSEDVDVCSVCERADREDVLLLCDGCEGAIHTFCHTPALEEIPSGDWYCPSCRIERRRIRRRVVVSEDEGE